MLSSAPGALPQVKHCREVRRTLLATVQAVSDRRSVHGDSPPAEHRATGRCDLESYQGTGRLRQVIVQVEADRPRSLAIIEKQREAGGQRNAAGWR